MRRLRAVSTADEIVNKIRERILVGDLKPRERLTLRQLASEFGSSVIPARDAVQRLLGEGLAVQVGQKTIVVAPMNVGDFLDIMEIRILLEPRALELSIPHLTAADFAEARKIMRSSTKALRPFAFSELHRKFHMVLYRQAGRSRMLETIERQHIHLVRYLSPHWAVEGVQADWSEGEEELMRYVEERRVADAVAFLRRDLEDAMVRVLRAIAF